MPALNPEILGVGSEVMSDVSLPSGKPALSRTSSSDTPGWID